MPGSYDGSIRIDTSINNKPLDAGLNSIESKLKGIGALIGTIFSVKALADFSNGAIDAASDLTEAQNVVDTAFGAMSHKMEQFADTALDTYGISELTAKKMGSTYMAMAKGMSVATDAASDMAVTLTGRLSDIMSFYNKTQSEVDTIGRAVLSGETEPLKQIGIVMTQNNLAAYAMAQGFEKAYDEMSSGEQLIVRYKYFLEQTALAQGDFAKTSENWANQTRLLNERWNEFITNAGGVLINIFTPALQFANEAVGFINELFFGGKAEDTAIATNAAGIAEEVEGVGTAAEKSQKKLNGLLSGFDELHIISGADSGTEDDTAASIDTSDLLGVKLSSDASVAQKAAGKYRKILDEIYVAFKRHPLTKIIKELISGIGDFFDVIEDNGDFNYDGTVTALMDILAAILAYKAISGVTGSVKMFAGGFGGLLKIITAHPVAAAAVGIAALATGIYLLDKEIRRQEIASHFGDITITMEEMDELTTPITKDIDKLATAFSESEGKISSAKEHFDELSGSIEDVFKTLKNGGKVDDSITAQIDEWIDAALGYNDAALDNSAMRALFASDGIINASEQAVLDQYSDLQSNISVKVETIRSQIHEITQAAADENRALMESELQNIQELYSQIAQMTAAQGDIQSSAAWEKLISRAYTYESYDALLAEITAAREQSEKSLAGIETATFEQMMSMLSIMEANGASDAEIKAEKDRQIAAIKESMEKKQQEMYLYELELLNAFGEAHYSFTEEAAFQEVMNEFFTTDVQKEKFRQYYDLFKKMQENGASEADEAQLMQLAQTLGDEAYWRALTELIERIGKDDSYGDWGTERREVVNALEELGYECGDGYTTEFAAVIEDAEYIDGTKLLSDVTAFTKLGTESGQAYVDAIIEYIEASNLGFMLNTSQGAEHFQNKLYGWEAYYGKNDTWWGGTSASYGQQPAIEGVTSGGSNVVFEFPIYLPDGTLVDTITTTAPTVIHPDAIMTNLKGQ